MKFVLLAVALALQTLSIRAADNIQVYFSPNGQCTQAITNELGQAKSNILVQAYSFTSSPIARALVDANNRGVKVQVILDKGQKTEKYSSADFLNNSGVPTYIDEAHLRAHNKIMIVDGQTVITGSFNFTKSAETTNAENLLVIKDAQLAEQYLTNWNAHFKHSERYQGRESK